MAAACHLTIRPCGKCATRSDLDDRRRVFWDLMLHDPGLRDRCAIKLSEPHEVACVTVSGQLLAAQMEQLLRYVRRSFTCYRTFGVASTGTATAARRSAIIRDWTNVTGSGAFFNGDGSGEADARETLIDWCDVGVWFLRCDETGRGRTTAGGMIGMLSTSEGVEQHFSCDRCSQLEATAADIVHHFQQAHGHKTKHVSSLSSSPSSVSFEGQATGNWLGRLMAACCCAWKGRGELDA